MADKHKKEVSEDLYILPGQKFGKFSEPCEPTDVIWENRHWTFWQRKRREVTAYGVVLVILFFSFWFIFFLAAKSIWVTRVFPAVDCDTMDATYGT